MVNQDEEAMVSQDGEWRRKDATLSDKTARAEFGLPTERPQGSACDDCHVERLRCLQR
jgi:hypothetical protein